MSQDPPFGSGEAVLTPKQDSVSPTNPLLSRTPRIDGVKTVTGATNASSLRGEMTWPSPPTTLPSTRLSTAPLGVRLSADPSSTAPSTAPTSPARPLSTAASTPQRNTAASSPTVSPRQNHGKTPAYSIELTPVTASRAPPPRSVIPSVSPCTPDTTPKKKIVAFENPLVTKISYRTPSTDESLLALELAGSAHLGRGPGHFKDFDWSYSSSEESTAAQPPATSLDQRTTVPFETFGPSLYVPSEAPPVAQPSTGTVQQDTINRSRITATLLAQSSSVQRYLSEPPPTLPTQSSPSARQPPVKSANENRPPTPAHHFTASASQSTRVSPAPHTTSSPLSCSTSEPSGATKFSSPLRTPAQSSSIPLAPKPPPLATSTSKDSFESFLLGIGAQFPYKPPLTVASPPLATPKPTRSLSRLFLENERASQNVALSPPLASPKSTHSLNTLVLENNPPRDLPSPPPTPPGPPAPTYSSTPFLSSLASSLTSSLPPRIGTPPFGSPFRARSIDWEWLRTTTPVGWNVDAPLGQWGEGRDAGYEGPVDSEGEEAAKQDGGNVGSTGGMTDEGRGDGCAGRD
jgi:hypothetical protein